MICKACNAANEEGALFCANCGATLEQAPAAAPVYEAPACETPAVDPGKTLGMVSLILGIVGLLLGTICACVCSCIGWIGPVLSIVALVLGIIAGKKSKEAGFKNTMATVGLILGIVGIVLGAVGLIIGLISGLSNVLISMITGSSSYSDPYTYSYYGY